ncbi:MAG: hypothetical protein JSV66_17940 [Trueperaceae bacterium]|nr:MAG: hypothetical protein JSV66_17940 [Trueperaceae bacterium]
MKQLFWILLVLLANVALAQQSARVSGLVNVEDGIVAGTRVAIHLVDSDGVWGYEVDSVLPVAGTFSVTVEPLPSEELRPFRSGAAVLPGLQNEYLVTPDDVNFAQARVHMYVDQNDNELFDREIDDFYIGVLSLEDPVGFFSLLYVDRDATMTAIGVELTLRPGWNIFSVRFPEGASGPVYDIGPLVDDAVMDVFLP